MRAEHDTGGKPLAAFDDAARTLTLKRGRGEDAEERSERKLC